jgi:aquaporin Z
MIMRTNPLILRQFLAEFYGTFVLVLVGTGSLAFGLGNQLVGVAFAFGTGAMIAIYTIGHISGAHLNPAVTLAMVIDQRMSFKTAIIYVIAQVLGGFFASLTLLLASDTSVYQGLGASGVDTTNVPLYLAFIFEMVLTFVLVYTVLVISKRQSLHNLIGIIVVFLLVGLILIGGPISSAGLNPARSLAPALLTGGEPLAQLWVYIIGPLSGSFLASVLYRYLKYPENTLPQK